MALYPEDVVFHESANLWAKVIFNNGDVPTEQVDPDWPGLVAVDD